MSNKDRDLDALLRRNVQRQLETFDWDRQRHAVMQHLAAAGIQKPHRAMAIRLAIGVAAMLALAATYLGLSLLPRTDRNAAAPREVAALRESIGDHSLLASTDPATILLTGPLRWRVLNDPLLTLDALRE